MFGTESLSLDFLSPYNTNLPPELTPFYGSPAMTNRMFANYQCIALPTQPGLAATFNSHPNVGGLLAGGNFETSLIKLLNAHGYATYFLMSGPETFLNDGVVFRQMGFQHVIGSQTWLKDPRFAPFVNDRGLMDRQLFKIALDLLDQNRDKKIFIDVMSGDTHSPYPREDYGSLQYPPTPACVSRLTSDPQARAILTDIFRHDYDIGLAVQGIQDRNLLTTNMLVILTADHNFPHGEALDKIPGYPKTPFSRIPLVFLSGQPLPPPAGLRQLHSQLDFAPSIVHLLGWPVPEGWWGKSVFESTVDAPALSKIGRNLVVTPLDGPRQVVSLDHPNGAAEKGLVKLFLSVYTNSPPAGAAGAGSQVDLP
jgi:phosphoglycerol transferase MdoB-like AlkP superfamily enzyme